MVEAMERMGLVKLQTLGVVLAAALAVGACKAADTGSDPGPGASPTPIDPQNPYTGEVYAKALRSASLKLRDKLPSVSDTDTIINAKDPRLEYERIIDGYLDPVANPDLIPTMQTHWKTILLMGDKTENLTAGDNGQAFTVNYSEPANLAAWLIASGNPWTDIIHADYCIQDNIDPANFDAAKVACPTNSPVLAGWFTHPAFLRTFGKNSALNLQRSSIAHQIATCSIYPDGSDEFGLIKTNGSGADPQEILPDQDPGGMTVDGTGTMARQHKKFQGNMDATTECNICHQHQNLRRLVFAKYVTTQLGPNNMGDDGFYFPSATITDWETPNENTGKLYAIPPGFSYTPGDCNQQNGVVNDCSCYTDVNDAMASDGGGCVDMTLDDGDTAVTDMNAYGVLACSDPASPWCSTFYHGQPMDNPLDYANLLLDGSYDDNVFYKCQARRFLAFVIGSGEGALGLQAANGTPPDNPGGAVIQKYQTAFAHMNYNARELLKYMFKQDEFLSSQAPPAGTN